MRKRLLIGAIALAAIGVGTYFVCTPGTVEHHKEAYRKNYEALPHGHFVQRKAPEFIEDAILRFRKSRIAHHRKELLRLGYLAEVTFVASNAPPEAVMDRVYGSLWGIGAYEPQLIPEKVDRSFFEWDWDPGTNLSRVICLRSEVDKLRRAFIAADVDDATWEQKLPKTNRYE